MKERPILFNGEMVRAILAGKKSQTRRVIVPQPPATMVRAAAGVTGWWVGWDAEGNEVWGARCPYGVPGDALWVRETWAVVWAEYEPDWECGQTIWDVPHRIEYRADTGARYPGGWPDDAGDDPQCPRWRPSIHMPRRASRITLLVTDTRVQRVQDITAKDVEAEGVNVVAALPLVPPQTDKLDALIEAVARDLFRELWDPINAERGYSWQSNPWVWPVTFCLDRHATRAGSD